jgi:hypothetical protein
MAHVTTLTYILQKELRGMILIKLERKDSHICSHSFLDLYDLGNIIKVKGNSKCVPGSTLYQKSKGIEEVLVVALLIGDTEKTCVCPFDAQDVYLENFCNCKAHYG